MTTASVRQVSSSHQIAALLRKDLTLFLRNRFFAFVTILGLVFYILIYFILPADVDETLRLVFFTEEQFVELSDIPENEALVIEYVASQTALEEAVMAGDFHAGITWSPDLPTQIAAGQRGQIDVYFSGETPQELQEAVLLIMREVVFNAMGFPLNIEENTITLGPDRIGDQVPLRDRMIPLIAVFIMLTEMLGLASLISEEIVTRTLTALLITPLTIAGLFTAKGIIGTTLAFGQAVILMLLTGSLAQQTLLILVALLLGAVLVTGIGFLIASLGKDLMSVMAWGIPVMLIFAIPALAVMLPGLASDWVQVIPSYYLADTIFQAANFNAGWDELWINLIILLIIDLVVLALGIVALRRKTI